MSQTSASATDHSVNNPQHPDTQPATTQHHGSTQHQTSSEPTQQMRELVETQWRLHYHHRTQTVWLTDPEQVWMTRGTVQDEDRWATSRRRRNAMVPPRSPSPTTTPPRASQPQPTGAQPDLRPQPHSSAAHGTGSTAGAKCPICRQEFRTGLAIVSCWKGCGKKFHKSCSESWTLWKPNWVQGDPRCACSDSNGY